MLRKPGAWRPDVTLPDVAPGHDHEFREETEPCWTSVLKYGNAKTFFLLSVASLAVYFGSDLINQGHSIIVPLDNGNNIVTPNHGTVVGNWLTACETIILYEAHNDPEPTGFVLAMLPYFKAHNYTTFLFEEPKSMNVHENIEALRQIYKIHDSLKPMFKDLIKSYEITIKLLEKIKELELTYVAVDMGTIARNNMASDGHFDVKVRDQFMAQSINEACVQYKSGQVFIVGAMHGGIARILKELGHKVISAYIIKHKELIDPDAPEGMQMNDVMLRNGNIEYMKKYGYDGMHVINYWDNSAREEAGKAFVREIMDSRSGKRPLQEESDAKTRDTEPMPRTKQQASRMSMEEAWKIGQKEQDLSDAWNPTPASDTPSEPDQEPLLGEPGSTH
jgi:hypothetical protein